MQRSVGVQFDELVATGTEHAINYFVYHQSEALLACRRVAVVEHFGARVRGPSLMAADALERVLCALGPCALLETVLEDWIVQGRFDGPIDAPDRSTSAQFCGGLLTSCLESGRFPRNWRPVDVALTHWRGPLSHPDPAVHRTGLQIMHTLLDFQQDIGGRLPAGVLPALSAGSPAAWAISTGFRAVSMKKRHPEARGTDSRLRDARSWLSREVYGER